MTEQGKKNRMEKKTTTLKVELFSFTEYTQVDRGNCGFYLSFSPDCSVMSMFQRTEIEQKGEGTVSLSRFAWNLSFFFVVYFLKCVDLYCVFPMYLVELKRILRT